MDVLITLTALLVLDFAWFRYALPNVYDPVFKRINGSDFAYRMQYGLVAWVLLALGIKYFVLEGAKSEREVAMRGALFGLVTYGVYNGTNMATIKKWTPKVAISDTAWGMFVCTAAALITRKVA